MKHLAKKIINGSLRPLNFQVVQALNTEIEGLHLFNDLPGIIGKSDPMCIDVGANEGQTIESLQEKFQNPTIHAFEPSTATFEQLKSKNFGDRVFLHNYALGKEKEERPFLNYSNSTLSSFLKLEDDEENHLCATDLDNTEVVEIDTLDSFFARNSITDVDLLKIDTQGFDLDVLMGAQNALQTGIVKHVLIEINYIKFYENQCSPEDILRLMTSNGLYLIDSYEKIRRQKTIAWCTSLFGRRDPA